MTLRDEVEPKESIRIPIPKTSQSGEAHSSPLIGLFMFQLQ